MKICGRKLLVVRDAAIEPIKVTKNASDKAIKEKKDTDVCAASTAAHYLSDIKKHIITIITYIIAPSCVQLKDLIDGTVVGSGSDYIVIQKGKKRLLLECAEFKVKELKSHGTPYGSQFD